MIDVEHLSETVYKVQGEFWNRTCREISDSIPRPQLNDGQEFNFDGGVKNSEVYNKYDHHVDVNMPTKEMNKPMSCIKVRFYPTARQQILLEGYFGAHRYFYNAAIDYWKSLSPKKQGKPLSKIGIIKAVVPPNKNLTSKSQEWMKKINTPVKRGGAVAFAEAQSAAVANKHILRNFKRLKKSNKRQTFHAEKTSIRYLLNSKHQFQMFTDGFGETNSIFKIDNKGLKNLKKFFPNNIDHDYQVLRDGKMYYLCLSYVRKTFIDHSVTDSIVALDPGIKVFNTFYSRNLCGKLGTNIGDITEKIHFTVKKLENVLKKHKLTPHKRRGIQKRCKKLRAKAHHIVENFQWHCVNYLLENFDVILLPEFSVKNMKNVGRSTKRIGYAQCHYQFAQKLQQRVDQRKDRVLIRCNESYTSKTCSACGYQDDKLGTARIYDCPNCKVVQDRDLNAARNIMIKHIMLHNMF